MTYKLFLTTLLLSSALARTDLEGCTSFDTVATPSGGGTPYATRIWYVPDTGELCDFLDCGGGRAPPKTTVPGCPGYEGTATYSPDFINPKTLGGVAQSTAIADPSSAFPSDTAVVTTEAPVTQSETETASETESAVETESATASSNSAVQTSSGEASTASESASAVNSASPSITTKVAGGKTTTAAVTGTAISKASSASGGAASASAPSSSSVSTGAGALQTAGGMLAFAAGAAVYVGMI